MLDYSNSNAKKRTNENGVTLKIGLSSNFFQNNNIGLILKFKNLKTNKQTTTTMKKKKIQNFATYLFEIVTFKPKKITNAKPMNPNGAEPRHSIFQPSSTVKTEALRGPLTWPCIKFTPSYITYSFTVILTHATLRPLFQFKISHQDPLFLSLSH